MQTIGSHTPFGVLTVLIPEELDKEFECEINIPSCYDERKILVYTGLANADNLPPGDLEVSLIIIKHKVFKRISGTLDLQTELNISLKESLTGFKRKIILLNSDDPVIINCESSSESI